MLVVSDDQQRLRPERPSAKTIVDIGDQLLAEADDMRRMLIVGEGEIGEVVGLDERVGRQRPGLRVMLEVEIEAEMIGTTP
jgi:hypothetical protein